MGNMTISWQPKDHFYPPREEKSKSNFLSQYFGQMNEVKNSPNLVDSETQTVEPNISALSETETPKEESGSPTPENPVDSLTVLINGREGSGAFYTKRFFIIANLVEYLIYVFIVAMINGVMFTFIKMRGMVENVIVYNIIFAVLLIIIGFREIYFVLIFDAKKGTFTRKIYSINSLIFC